MNTYLLDELDDEIAAAKRNMELAKETEQAERATYWRGYLAALIRAKIIAEQAD